MLVGNNHWVVNGRVKLGCPQPVAHKQVVGGKLEQVEEKGKRQNLSKIELAIWLEQAPNGDM